MTMIMGIVVLVFGGLVVACLAGRASPSGGGRAKRKRLELILFANCGYGIRSEDRQLLALLLERLQRPLHFGVFLVAVEIDEEDVLLLAGLGGERLDPVEIQFVGFKDVECIHKRSGVVRDLEHEGGLVVASALAFLQADDGEAG